MIFAQTKDAKYIGSSKSDKYHYTTCEWAKKISSSNLVIFKTVAEATNAGYKACKVCKPPTSESATESIRSVTPSTKKSEGYSGRCQATTKKGTQCKRNAKPGSSYCWQHGG